KNIYYYKNEKGEETVGGSFNTWVDRKYNSVSFATVYNAGHQIGNSQILVSKSMVYDMMNGGKLLCHRENDETCMADQSVCAKMNSCGYHGQCMHNRCFCDYETAFGADCSILPTNLTTGTLEMFPRQWAYYKVP